MNDGTIDNRAEGAVSVGERECMNPRHTQAMRVLDQLGIDPANAESEMRKYIAQGHTLPYETMVLLAERGIVPLQRSPIEVERSNAGYRGIVK